MVYGKRIKEVRTCLNMKQKSMAKKLGVSASYLSLIESGERGANGLFIIRFLNEFNVNSEWLYNGTDPIFNEPDNCVYIKSATVNDNSKQYDLPILRRYIKERLKTVDKKLLYFTLKNDSMEPTLKKDDLLIVDISQNTPDDEGIYLVRIDDIIMVRRLSLVPQRNLQADNSTIKHSMILIDSSIEFIGKVVSFTRAV